MLNLTPEIFVHSITISIFVLGTSIVGYHYSKKRIKPYLFLFLMMSSYTIYLIIEGLGYLFLEFAFRRISFIFFFITLILLVATIDYMTREEINVYKMSLVVAVGILLVVYAWQPDSIGFSEWNGYPSIAPSGNFVYIYQLANIIIGLLHLHWTALTYWKSPAALKKDALLLLIGSCTMGPFTFIPVLLSPLLGPIYIVFQSWIMAIGSLITVIAITKQPKLVYILPFIAYRLIVIDKNSGLCLFDHLWTEKEIEESLFSGLLFSLQQMSLEVLKSGELKEICLTNGMLILQETEHIYVGLLASKPSKYLRESIQKFAETFNNKFEQKIKKMLLNKNDFKSAQQLVDRYFSNVPYRYTIKN